VSASPWMPAMSTSGPSSPVPCFAAVPADQAVLPGLYICTELETHAALTAEQLREHVQDHYLLTVMLAAVLRDFLFHGATIIEARSRDTFPDHAQVIAGFLDVKLLSSLLQALQEQGSAAMADLARLRRRVGFGGRNFLSAHAALWSWGGKRGAKRRPARQLPEI
jgi:hypothetical protein